VEEIVRRKYVKSSCCQSFRTPRGRCFNCPGEEDEASELMIDVDEDILNEGTPK